MSHQTEEEGLWFRIGYALERFTGGENSEPEAEPRANPSGDAKARGDGSSAREGNEAGGDALVATAVGAVASRLMRAWRPREGPGVLALAASAGAGAGAALVVDVSARAIRGEERGPRDRAGLGDRLLAGAGRGVVYAAIFAPRLPGPPVLRGLLYGGAECLASPWGGTTSLLGRANPLRKLPFGRRLLEPGPVGRATGAVEHLLFGVSLAVAYGALVEKRGTSGDA